LPTFAFASIGAVVSMRVEDYYPKGKRWWFRLHEKGGKRHEMPAHHNLEAYLDAYIEAAVYQTGVASLKRSVPIQRDDGQTRQHAARYGCLCPRSHHAWQKALSCVRWPHKMGSGHTRQDVRRRRATSRTQRSAIMELDGHLTRCLFTKNVLLK
jgi:hypothetical protein